MLSLRPRRHPAAVKSVNSSNFSTVQNRRLGDYFRLSLVLLESPPTHMRVCCFLLEPRVSSPSLPPSGCLCPLRVFRLHFLRRPHLLGAPATQPLCPHALPLMMGLIRAFSLCALSSSLPLSFFSSIATSPPPSPPLLLVSDFLSLPGIGSPRDITLKPVDFPKIGFQKERPASLPLFKHLSVQQFLRYT